jgi:hypothetical protein
MANFIRSLNPFVNYDGRKVVNFINIYRQKEKKIKYCLLGKLMTLTVKICGLSVSVSQLSLTSLFHFGNNKSKTNFESSLLGTFLNTSV